MQPGKQQAFATALRETRRRAGLSRAVLAVRANVSEYALRDAERGLWLPHPALLVQLADPLDVEPAPLLWLWLRAKIGDDLADLMAEGVTNPLMI